MTNQPEIPASVANLDRFNDHDSAIFANHFEEPLSEGRKLSGDEMRDLITRVCDEMTPHGRMIIYSIVKIISDQDSGQHLTQ